MKTTETVAGINIETTVAQVHLVEELIAMIIKIDEEMAEEIIDTTKTVIDQEALIHGIVTQITNITVPI